MFKSKMFGYDKKQVCEFVNASIDYVVKLKKDIEFLKYECDSIRKRIETYENNNERYFKIIDDAYSQAEMIIKKAEIQAEKLLSKATEGKTT